MGVFRSLRCIRGVPAPMLALSFVACATGTDPPEGEGGGGSSGASLGGAAPSAGAPTGGAVNGGTPSFAGSFGTAGGGTGGKGIFGGGTGGASGGGGGTQAGAAGSGGASSGSGGVSGGGGSAGKGGASGMGGAAAGTGGGGSGGTAGTGMPNGGAGGGCANPVVSLKTSEGATVKSNACLELTHNPTWSGVNVHFQITKGSGLPIPYSYGSCVTSGKGSATALYQDQFLYKGAPPKCGTFVQLEGSGADVDVMHYD